MRVSVTAAAATAAVMVALLAGLADTPAVASSDGDVIQPGDQLNGMCTLNFVFDGYVERNRGKVYVGTAAHCVRSVGDRATTPGVGEFGTVVYVGNFAAGTQFDFALIDVDAAYVARVSPALRGHPELPRWGFSPAPAFPGTPVRFSGCGDIVCEAQVSREGRIGVLLGQSQRTYDAEGPLVPGDSGGPVVEHEHLSGRAVGVVASFLCCPPVFEGPTVEGIESDLWGAGLPAELRPVCRSC